MRFHSDNNLFYRKGFSLIEAVAALGVLAVITSSVLVIVDQCMNSTADMTLRRNAFEIARENMEILMTEKTVCEKSEFGESELYPEVEWQTTIEMFQPQGGKDKWLKAICSSQYYDSKNEIQTVEFTAWLTILSNRDVAKIQKQREILRELEGIDNTGQTGDLASDGQTTENSADTKIPTQDTTTDPDGSPKTKTDPAWWSDPLFQGLPPELQKRIKDSYYKK